MQYCCIYCLILSSICPAASQATFSCSVCTLKTGKSRRDTKKIILYALVQQWHIITITILSSVLKKQKTSLRD